MRESELLKEPVYFITYNLQFFADDGDKTEDPTAKKLNDARDKGQVARSNELITASGLATFFLILKIFVGYFGTQFIDSFRLFFGSIGKFAGEDFSVVSAQSILAEMFMRVIYIGMPVFIITVIVTTVVLLFQVKWKISGKTIQPKFSKLNPVNGFKRILSKDKIVELFIDIIKIVLICFISYSTLKKEWETLLILCDLELTNAIIMIGNIIISLGLKISLFFLVIGLGDLIYQKLKFRKDMRMSKQEVKDEYKNSEGDPQIKGKIRAKMKEVSMKRMMQALPKADVVITNPTHLAAAIMYDKQNSTAPVLVAKGADFLAQKIKEVAAEHNIEVVENKPLARMLYYNVEIGAEIPPELYQMTAEVLAYVYGLKNKVG